MILAEQTGANNYSAKALLLRQQQNGMQQDKQQSILAKVNILNKEIQLSYIEFGNVVIGTIAEHASTFTRDGLQHHAQLFGEAIAHPCELVVGSLSGEVVNVFQQLAMDVFTLAAQ